MECGNLVLESGQSSGKGDIVPGQKCRRLNNKKDIMKFYRLFCGLGFEITWMPGDRCPFAMGRKASGNKCPYYL